MKSKKDNKKPQELYLKIPHKILNIGGLGLSEKVLLAYIHSFGRKGCWQSNKTIATALFTNTRSVQRWLQRINKYILVKCPRGYYRTIWCKGNSEVQEGIRDWQRKQDERRAKRLPKKARRSTPHQAQSCDEPKPAEVRQNRRTQYDTSGALSTTHPSVEPRQIRRTIKNHTIKEITKETTATPAPSPVEGRASALLNDRDEEAKQEIEKFKNKFGVTKGRTAPELTDAEIEQRRQQNLKALAEVGG